MASYVTAKHGMVGLTRSAALDSDVNGSAAEGEPAALLLLPAE
jgi:hypothetical protein